MCSHTFGAYKQKKCYFHAKIYAKVLQISRIVVPLHQNYKLQVFSQVIDCDRLLVLGKQEIVIQGRQVLESKGKQEIVNQGRQVLESKGK